MATGPMIWHFKSGRLEISQSMIGGVGKSGVLIVLLVLALWGCEFRRVVVNDPLITESLKELVPGQSSFHDVTQTLGAPDEIEEGSAGMVFRYRYGDSKTMRINFGWIFRLFLPLAPAMNLGRGEGVTYVLHVAMRPDMTFDHSVIQPPPDPPRFWFWPF